MNVWNRKEVNGRRTKYDIIISEKVLQTGLQREENGWSYQWQKKYVKMTEIQWSILGWFGVE